MLITSMFEQALAIKSPWFVKEIQFSAKEKQLDIYIDFHRGSVFESGECSFHTAYDTEQKTWRHLYFFEHTCYLHCRTPRVKLKSGKVRQISPPWAGLSNGFALLGMVLLIGKNHKSTMAFLKGSTLLFKRQNQEREDSAMSNIS